MSTDDPKPLSEFTQHILATYRETWKEIVMSPEVSMAILGVDAELAVDHLSDIDLLQVILREQSQMLIAQTVDLGALSTALQEARAANASLQIKMAEKSLLIPTRAQRRS